jgi:hypothetical protein
MSAEKKVMLTEETEKKKENVYITQEGIEVLSEYSWDMTGYTSRFGFFCLGNEKADVEGLTRWQAEHIFQLTPLPPGIEDELQNMEKTQRFDKEKRREIIKKNEAVGDTFLAQAVREKNLLYFSFYLHAYESRLNGKVRSFLRRNGMDPYDPVHFLDMKLALQELLLKKLPTFDPDRGAKFTTYCHEFIGDAFLTFRMQEECWQIDSLDIYKGVRKIAAIYNACGKDVTKAILQYCADTGCQPQTAVRYLEQAIGIRARQTETIVDWEEDDEVIVEDVIPDGTGDLCYALIKAQLTEAVQNAMGKLSWKDQSILNNRLAICIYCGGVRPMKERYSYREIARLIRAGTEKAGEKAYHTAVQHLREQLAQDDVIRVVDFELVSTEKVKKKIAAATYRYLADCDGEWGEIRFDFIKNKATILQLADWDTSRSHLYAKKVIGQILPIHGTHLPKKEQIAFER